MYLTKCAVCATELGLTLGKKCGRCSTRYCGPECQEQHWKEGGHDKLCKVIKKAGGAEQYNANQKYSKAVTVAAEACAEDTKGQTCYICRESSHRRTKEGLVRGCACHTTEGFVHVSCLAEQAKLLVTEAEENYNLYGTETGGSSWAQWRMCSLCKQNYHGVVACALGWACWKTYLGRPERDQVRCMALQVLGNGLLLADHLEDACSVAEIDLSTLRRIGAPEDYILVSQNNLAGTYQSLRRFEDASRMLRDVYSIWLKRHGAEHGDALLAALNYAASLVNLHRYKEAKSLMRRMIPVARRVLGESNELTLKMSGCYAEALKKDPGATLDDLHEAVRTLEDLQRTARRVLGSAHPVAVNIDLTLRESQEVLSLARKTGDVRITQAVQHLYNLRTPFREDDTQLVVSVHRDDKPLPVETEDGDADTR